MSTADRKMGACRTVLCPKQLSAGEGNYVLSHRDLNYLVWILFFYMRATIIA